MSGGQPLVPRLCHGKGDGRGIGKTKYAIARNAKVGRTFVAILTEMGAAKFLRSF